VASATKSRGTAEISVMSFNIFYGGDELDLTTGGFCEVPDSCDETLQTVIATIKDSGADVVGVQEAERNTRHIAEALGWYYNERSHLVSRFPLIDPPGADGLYAFVEVSPGRVVAIANLHLTSDPYGPYAVRDGASADEVLALEHSVRMPDIQSLLGALPDLANQGIPVFVTGDFNSPSHLDWTTAVADVRPDVPYALAWPVSQTLAAAGLHDSYRDVYPDPIAKPGFTWTPGGPESAPEGQEVFDRIDRVLASGQATTTASKIVGEVGGPDVDIGIARYPSDHRAVVSTFEVRPVSPKPFVAVAQRRAFVGDRLSVDVHAPSQRGVRLGLRKIDSHEQRDLVAVQNVPRGADIRVDFATGRLRPGDYEVVLVAGKHDIISRSPFWLYKPGTPPSVKTSERSYDVGEPIDVSWNAAPGIRRDWIAVYRCVDGGECEPNSQYLVWAYTQAAIEGRLEVGPDSFGGIETWPLPPGRYVVRLLTDDSFVDLATSKRFTIR
jgi:endonuclease/exonuclease/phosphatase family metal-dependent hydrolase